MKRGSLYPGVTTTDKKSPNRVEHMSQMEDRPYLCVAYDIEETSIQPLRLAATAAGLGIVYVSRQLPEDQPLLRAFTAITGLGMTAWSGFIFYKAQTEINRGKAERAKKK